MKKLYSIVVGLLLVGCFQTPTENSEGDSLPQVSSQDLSSNKGLSSVAEASSSNEGSSSSKISSIAAEPGTSFYTAFNRPESDFSELKTIQNGFENWYRFESSPDSVYVFTVKSKGDVVFQDYYTNTSMFLTYAKSRLLEGSDVVLESYINRPEAKTYHYVIEPVQNCPETCQYSIKLDVYHVEDDDHDHTDNYLSGYYASIIGTGLTTSQLHYQFDEDALKFKMNEGYYYQVEVNWADTSVYLSVNNDNCKVEDYEAIPRVLWCAIGISDNRFDRSLNSYGMIEVKSKNPFNHSYPHYYDIDVQEVIIPVDDHGDSNLDATSMNSDVEHVGSIEYLLDKDVFNITLKKDYKYQLVLSSDKIEHLYLDYDVYRSDNYFSDVEEFYNREQNIVYEFWNHSDKDVKTFEIINYTSHIAAIDYKISINKVDSL